MSSNFAGSHDRSAGSMAQNSKIFAYWMYVLSQLSTLALWQLNHSRNIEGWYAATWWVCLYVLRPWCNKPFRRTSRLSLLCTILRIATPPHLSRLLRISVWLFCLSWFVLSAQLLWVCIPQPAWRAMPTPQCLLGANVVIAQSISMLTLSVHRLIRR